jgi:hypothetical protein
MSANLLEEWKRLPWLLTRKQVKAITGLSDEEVDKAVRAEILHRHAIGAKGRYFKQEVMRMCRIEVV